MLVDKFQKRVMIGLPPRQREASKYVVCELITDEHISDVLAMSKVFIAEYNSPLEFDEEEVTNTCTTVKQDMNREDFNIFMAYDGGEPVGFMFASCTKYLFNKQQYASQDLLFIRPAYRGTKAFLLLLRVYEEWARLRGCVEIWTGSVDNDAFSKILPRIGYPKVGSYHRKRTI